MKKVVLILMALFSVVALFAWAEFIPEFEVAPQAEQTKEISKQKSEIKKNVGNIETVVIETNYGNIVLELDRKLAPISVANFLTYADKGHYKDTIFHRVIKDFMIQGGNFNAEMSPKKTMPQIKNEATNGLRNQRGTIAMARTGVVDSASSQFFINLKDNAFLDHKNTSTRGYGYAVFGKVVAGMDVVDKIGTTPTHTYRRFQDVPVKPVVILSVKRVAKETTGTPPK